MTDEFYSSQGSEYLANTPTWHVEDSPSKAAKILSLIAKNDIPVSSIIEVGCGAGGILKCLSEMLPTSEKLSGYDIAPDAISLCAGKESERLHYYCEDPFSKSETFDLLLAIDVVEHVDDYFGFIRKCKDKAAYKIIKVPLELSVRSILLNQHFKNRKRVGHIHYFSKDSFLLTLQDCGLEIIDYQYHSGPIDSRTAKFSRLRSFLFNVSNKDIFVRLTGGYGLFVLAK